MFTPLAFNKESIVTRGLVFHVDAADRTSYSPGSGVWNDLTGNGNNGTLTNGPGFDGANGGSISFDGSDDYVSLANNLGNPQQFTLTMWCKHTALNIDDTNNYRILFHCLGASSSPSLLITEQNGRTAFRVPGGSGTFWTTGGFSDLNQWGYITCIYDQIDRKVYFNGILEGTYSEPGVTVDFGSPRISHSVRAPEGNIANVKIYNRALTPSEITQNYNALKGRFGL